MFVLQNSKRQRMSVVSLVRQVLCKTVWTFPQIDKLIFENNFSIFILYTFVLRGKRDNILQPNLPIVRNLGCSFQLC